MVTVPSSTTTPRWDAVVVGSGFGGAMVAHRLVAAGARVLMLERGDRVARGERAWLPESSLELTPHYSLCVYSDDGESGPTVEQAVLPWDRCGEPPCWEGSAENGFTYRGVESLAGTLRSLVLPPSGSRQPKILAGGYLTADPAEPRASFGARNTVQLIMQLGDERRCWSSTHAGPLLANQCKNPIPPAAAMKPARWFPARPVQPRGSRQSGAVRLLARNRSSAAPPELPGQDGLDEQQPQHGPEKQAEIG